MTLQKEHVQGVACFGDKVKRLGTSIPVWVYAVDGLLVDTGPANLRSVLTPILRDLQPKQAAVTHLHEDHCGLASWLQEECQTDISLPTGSIPAARQQAKLPFYRRLFWGPRAPFEATPMPEELATPGGYRLQAIPTPGHMEEHVALFEPQRGWLFSGDLYVRPRPKLGFIDERMGSMIQSLKKCVQLDVQTLFCAHAGIVEQGGQALQSKLDYLLELRERKRELEKQGMGLKEIDRTLFPKKPLITYLSRGEWSSRHLLRTL